MSDWIPISSQKCRHCDEPMEVRKVYMGCEYIPATEFRHQRTQDPICYVKVGAEPRNHDKVRAELMEAETPKAISTAALYEQFAKMPPMRGKGNV